MPLVAPLVSSSATIGGERELSAVVRTSTRSNPPRRGFLMTAEIPAELLEAIRSARACMADIRALAEKLGDLSQGQIEATLQGFLETGEDRALSRLLQVCAFNEVKLDPEALCACIGVCEDILDSAPCFALQDERAIEPLLRAATAEALPFERQSYAAGLAAELTVKLGLDPQPVRKVLWKLEHATRAPEVQLLLAQSLRLLDEGQNPEQPPFPSGAPSGCPTCFPSTGPGP